MDGDQNREKGNNLPKTFILKWGNHKYRTSINAVDRGLPVAERVVAEEAPSTTATEPVGAEEAPSTTAAEPVVAEEAPSTAVAVLPWKLRVKNRTVALKSNDEENTAAEEEIKKNKKKAAEEEKMNLRSKTKKVKPPSRPMMKLAVALSQAEVEEDFLKMVGSKPPSRPKKRPRLVQRSVDTTYLGLSLEEIPRNRYDVKKVKG